MIIGEAVAALSHVSPRNFDAISNARRIVDFRNQLTHEYPTVDDALVWAIVTLAGSDRSDARVRAFSTLLSGAVKKRRIAGAHV